jgi:hypothetical protein
VRFAFERLAFARFEFERLAFVRFAFERFAFVKFTADRFSPEKFDPERFWPEQFEPQAGAALTRNVRVVRSESADAEPPARTTVASGSTTAAKITLAHARFLRVEDIDVGAA